MTENKEDLQRSLKDYESQLSQISDAISQNTESCEELISLRDNITELIALTKESITMVTTENDDPLGREYELFKTELQEYDNDNIEEELSRLIGNKCQAPFTEQWSAGSQTYHNALITSLDLVDSLDTIKVKVMFVNPTCKEMVPCKYYLDGECKFDDENCHFSHGYVVLFSDLREYKEPNFCLLKENSIVFAKDADDIWKRAIVTAVIPEQNQCCIKFESGRKLESIIDFHDVLPLSQSENCLPSSDDDDDDDDTDILEDDRPAVIEPSHSLEPPTVKLGEWEKFTSGIGSKLMAKMGYVVGTGLGKNSEGRVEPVVAVVLPPGKSLDHCMALREKAGGDPNLFKVNRLQKKLRRRIRNRKPVPEAPTKEQQNVFSFINDTISGESKGKEPTSFRTECAPLKKSTNQALNVKELKLSENMQKKQYELYVLRDRLTRQKKDTVGHNTLDKKVKQVENEIKNMQYGLKNIQKEQFYRQTMKELTEF